MCVFVCVCVWGGGGVKGEVTFDPDDRCMYLVLRLLYEESVFER